MKQSLLILMLLLMAGCSTSAHAGELYLELGFGYFKDLPVEGSVEVNQQVVIEKRVIVDIEEPYGTLAAGVMSDTGWFAEINRFGVLDDRNQSITRIEFGKRWGWEF